MVPFPMPKVFMNWKFKKWSYIYYMEIYSLENKIIFPNFVQNLKLYIMKRDKIIYYITTGLLSLLMLYSVSMYFFKYNVKIVLKCILEFSETFAKNSYFDQYSTIYLRSGCTIYKFDYVFVRISACVFSCFNQVQFH